ncbi:P-loop containing nucleoside triphosphate hydrolase protein [Serendipita vermifera]|nr:P-loop containing nucleoside triphosphate hydrolase protein [Serendipita vermifera]
MSSSEARCSSPPKRVVFVGIGGASGSGKTTLAKHLHSLIDGSIIIHQDEFGPSADKVPIHPIHNVPDWENPIGAVEWPRLIEHLQRTRTCGSILPEHKGHKGWDMEEESLLSQELIDQWKGQFQSLSNRHMERNGEELVLAIVEGWVLYWHPEVMNQVDIRIFLQGNYEEMKERRERRQGYVTDTGYVWEDPPQYWDNVVWPAYCNAHKRLFSKHDVEHGDPIFDDDIPNTGKSSFGQPVSGLIVFKTKGETIADLVQSACIAIGTSQVLNNSA